MKNWQETRAVVHAVLEAARAGRGVAVATVIQISGSAYRHPGAKLLVETDGTSLGGVSGGCLEADVREVALAAIGKRTPSLRHYDTGADEDTVWGLGLGCDGKVDVFVQPVTSELLPVWQRVAGLLEENDAFVLGTVVSGPAEGRSVVFARGSATGSTGIDELDDTLARLAAEGLADERSVFARVDDHAVFLEVLIPPARLVIIGAGDDAMPLARFAAGLGFRITVVDHRPAYLTEHRFPAASHRVHARPEDGTGPLELHADCYALVMNHALVRDREWIRLLLESPVPYIGVLGPRSRIEGILTGLGAGGSDRVFGPVGLDLGADGPEQIALSVLAEIMAVRAKRRPSHLRERNRTIHAR